LERLIKDGDMLDTAIRYNCNPDVYLQRFLELSDGDKDKAQELIQKLPNFREDYQKWYSQAHAIIKQVLPDRLSDFVAYYEFPRVRKNIDFQNYMIKDYLQGLKTTRFDGETVVDGSAAIPEFAQQLSMIKAARDTLDSTLLDLKAVLQADLFDSEIDTASALATAGYLRAAGSICGVIIEKHIRYVCENHNLKITKKNPGIADLLQLLRISNVITLAQERFIQSLADTRNLCSHAKGREPTKQEITELVDGTYKVLKTIF
jgi:hypothetical protein